MLSIRVRHDVLLLFLCVYLSWSYYAYVHFQYDELIRTEKDKKNRKTKNMLDGCYHVYLDVGSNIGVQIRKLFEPEKYPKGGIHSIFDKYFGTPKEAG